MTELIDELVADATRVAADNRRIGKIDTVLEGVPRILGLGELLGIGQREPRH